MPRAIFSLVIALMIAFVIMFACGCARRSHGRFPELRPVLDTPVGHTLTFQDGPDFYTWVLREEVGNRYRSGIGIYFGHFPNPRFNKEATELKGRVCAREVTWRVERKDDSEDRWIRRDTVMHYDHGPEYQPLFLHVWVWGPTDERVEELANKLDSLKFEHR